MINYEGKNIEEALPSTPVEILGMNASVFAGAEFFVTENEDKAKEISEFKTNSSGSPKKLISKDKKTLFEKQRKQKRT